REIIRRRVLPIYQHPALLPKDAETSSFDYATSGSITDGDDHEWTGDRDVLSGGGGWRGMMQKRRPETKYPEDTQVEESTTSKKRRTEKIIDLTTEVIDLTCSSPCPTTPESPNQSSPTAMCYSSELLGYGSDDEQELDNLINEIEKKAKAFDEAAAILRSQLKFKNTIWLKTHGDPKFGHD
ncbi:hypothetical protein H0H92_014795, partial [Tricholoma furcatifolium]